MNTTLTIKLPKELRDEAKATAAAVGLPISTVLQQYLRDFVEKKEITFSAPVVLERQSASKLPKEATKALRTARATKRSKLANL